MRKWLAAIVAAFLLTGLLAFGPAAQGDTSCTGEFPYFTAGATTETENEARIDCVHEKRAELAGREREITHRISAKQERIATIRESIARDKERRRAVRRLVELHSLLIQGMKAMRGIVANLALIRGCESGGDYGERPDEGATATDDPKGGHDGGYQFDYPTWQSTVRSLARSLWTFRSYMAPSWVQDWGGALLRKSRGTQPWPRCGV